MKWITAVLIFFYSVTSAQVDTLTNAKAYRTNFVPGNMYGRTSNNDVYAVAFTLNYDANGAGIETSIHRINLNTKEIQTKTIPGTVSAPYMFWRVLQDNQYRWIIGMNSNRDIYVIDFKDSILITNVGKFATGELAYSIQTGRDGDTYIGGSSGPWSTLWAILHNTTFTEKTVIDDNAQYTMAILGDTNYVYPEVGQFIYKIYAIRKSDNYKKLIYTQETLINTSIRDSGCYFQNSATGTWYLLRDTTATASTLKGTVIENREINVDFPQKAGLSIITNAFFDAVSSKFYWKLNNVADSVSVSSSYSQTTIRRVFPDIYDTNIVRFVGEYYGHVYAHNKQTGVTTDLGFPGMNVFSFYQDHDTIWMAGYPSAQLAKWVITEPWTAETFANGQVRHLSSTTNPKLLFYARTETTAGFHEPVKIVSNGDYLFFGGDVIRTDSTASFAVYNRATGQFWGFDKDSIPSLRYASLVSWGTDKAIFATRNPRYGDAKLYRYSLTGHTMIDSLNFGFHNMGYTFVIGDLLYGVAQDSVNRARFYKVNLSTAQLTYNQTTTGTINLVNLMPDYVIGINATGVTVPPGWAKTRTIGDRDYKYDDAGGYYTLYNNQGLTYQIIRRKNISTYTVDPNTAQGKQTILINQLR